jgi:hypothetical protein
LSLPHNPEIATFKLFDYSGRRVFVEILNYFMLKFARSIISKFTMTDTAALNQKYFK